MDVTRFNVASQRTPLSAAHSRQLVEDSSVAPEIAEARGYRTATKRDQLAELKGYQRRVPALVIPTHPLVGSPARILQTRPDNPRVRSGKPVKYETPAGTLATLDVHPTMHAAARDPERELWITEGIKKADALTSRGLCTVGLIGVWNWQRKGELLPEWEHVALDGRRVYVVFDADVMTKEGVQLALQRLVSALEGRGAEVRVVYLPGPEKGVDDFLAAGGTVAELRVLARRFEVEDLGRIRLSRDEKLRALDGELRRRWWAEEWKGRGGHSERDVALALIEAATRSGKPHPDGIRVPVSWGVLQVKAKVARKTLAGVLKRLEERGFCYRDTGGRQADRAGAFVLRAKVDHDGQRVAGEGSVSEGSDRGGLPSRAPLEAVPDVPRLRWSRPKHTPRRGTVPGSSRVRSGPTGQRRDPIERLGKIRGGIVDALEVAGGELNLRELCEVLHRKRPRDVRRRVLPMLIDAGVIAVEGDAVCLAPDWRGRLDAARRIGGELEADELAERRRKLKSAAFRGHLERAKKGAPEHDPEVTEADMDAARARRELEPDGFVEDLQPLSSLAVAVDSYLRINTNRATEYPSWLASTLYCYDWTPTRATRQEVEAALAELGGDTYRRELMESSRRSA